MSKFDENISAVVESLQSGFNPPNTTVRTMLSWFGAQRRGDRVVKQISDELDKRGLITIPDILEADIDSRVEFDLAPDKKYLEKVMYRVGDLQSANRKPQPVAPNDTFERVISVMMDKKYSQLPVMNGEGPNALRGVISWSTIGKMLYFGQQPKTAGECMNLKPEVMNLDDSLFNAIKIIAEHEYVLVRAKDKRICGIVTASDFSEQYSALAEPFLLIGEIERSIRSLLNAKFTKDDLNAFLDQGDGKKGKVGSLSDLGFGDYVRLMQNKSYWKRLSIPLDRNKFVERLDGIRVIRNNIMHFHQNGIGAEKLHTLKDFADFLAEIDQLSVS